MQLDALLKSLKRNTKSFFNKITIIYKCSDNKHYQSYCKLIEFHSEVNFIKENFFNRFRNILLKHVFDSTVDFTCFMVDDNLLYKSTNDYKEVILNFLNKDNEIACFSLRLGLNCTFSHPANIYFHIAEYQYLGTDIIKWNWRIQQPGDFNYPLALDGHIFKTDLIQSLIQKTEFIDPNTLEGGLQKFLPELSSYMASFTASHLVGVPVNLVNRTTTNNHGKKFFYHQDNLCNLFNDEYRIDIDRIKFDDIFGAHQELEYSFIKG